MIFNLSFDGAVLEFKEVGVNLSLEISEHLSGIKRPNLVVADGRLFNAVWISRTRKRGSKYSVKYITQSLLLWCECTSLRAEISKKQSLGVLEKALYVVDRQYGVSLVQVDVDKQ